MKKLHAMFVALMAASLLSFGGCAKDDPVGPDGTTVANEDAAESVASTMGQDDGGAMDQLADVSEIASAAGIQTGSTQAKGAAEPADAATIDTTYDPATGTWTVTLSRQRGSASGAYYANITRVYTYKLLNKDGVPQKYWRSVVPGSGVDTAASMVFTIVSGSGEHHTPHLSQKLTAIGGTWTVTGLNTNTLVINGTYTRSAVDTVTTRSAVRTLDHTIALTFTNVQVPRGARGELASKATGTISGTYNATITFSRGALYTDKNISKEFTITLGGGNGTITIGGKTFAALLTSGMLK